MSNPETPNEPTGYLVVLDENLTEEERADAVNVLQMIKGVVEVQPIISDPAGEAQVEARVNHEWKIRLMQLAGMEY